MITELLIKFFISDYKDTKKDRVRQKYGLLEGWASIVINVVLFSAKLFAGLWVGSISLIVDAVHSLSDMISSMAIIWGVTIAAAPPDKEHPFGHGRMEDITSLILSILLIVTGFEFFRMAFGRILSPEKVDLNGIAVLIIIISIIAKEWLSRFSKDLSIRIDSKVLRGDAIHHRTDSITSLLVLVALFSEEINFPMLDGIIGVTISVYIIYSGWEMIREVVSPLLGESATYQELHQIKSIAKAVELVEGVHDIAVHKYGQLKIISLHVEMSEDVPAMESHNIIEDIEDKINNWMNAYTVIHLDPLPKLTDELKSIHSKIASVVSGNPRIDSYHDLRIIEKSVGRSTLIVDIVSSTGTTPQQFPEICDFVAMALKKSFPEFNMKIWVEPKFYSSG